MAIIGTFLPTRDGGFSGTLRTLTINIKLRLVPNDNSENERAPAFRVFAGRSELGAAWREQTSGEQPRAYLSVKLDDPSLPEPIAAALFEGADGREAQLVWTRRSG
ncbi:MAG TPA: DUF736 domain-containing protein [Ferrovibrio sp.]|uniref:DUF736 domain-containing protein n=1 Tax=Ferrovibrio sp. TaxID=1917215 RepID=UPI002ED07263